MNYIIFDRIKLQYFDQLLHEFKVSTRVFNLVFIDSISPKEKLYGLNKFNIVEDKNRASEKQKQKMNHIFN